MASYPWLAGYRDRSVTELEVLYGALLQREPDTKRTLFFTRDPRYAQGRDPRTFDAESPAAAAKLGALKAGCGRRAELSCAALRCARRGCAVHKRDVASFGMEADPEGAPGPMAASGAMNHVLRIRPWPA
eukprot:tig00000310_g23981.t1